MTLGFFKLSAQKLNLEKISIKDGLSQSTVKYIEQDNYGNFWLATNYGLSKYNGKSFEVFTTTNGLPANEISTLLFYKDILYIGTKKGLCAFNGNKIDNNNLYKKINGNVKKILSQNNTIHIITSKGYYILNNIDKTPKLDSVAISSILAYSPTDAEFDEDGNLWISTSKHGVYFMENNPSTKIQKYSLIQNSASSTNLNKKLIRIANFNSSNLLKGDVITSIEFDSNKNLLLSDWGNGIALLKFDLGSGIFNINYLNFDSLFKDNISLTRYTNIQKDKENNIYLATDGFGFLKIPQDPNTHENDYNSKEIKLINNANGFFGNNPLCFLNDSFNNLWVGTLNDGLILISENSSLSYNQKNGLDEEKVISICKSQDSSIWLGTYGGGAFKFKNKKFTRCFWDQGISESIIKTLTEDEFGNIWLGTTGGGISIISKENTNKLLQVNKTITETNNLQSNFISYLYKSKTNEIWVGYQSQNSIDKIVFNKDFTYSITNYPITKLSNFNVSCIVEDDDNNIWITSNDGVWKVNEKTGKVDDDYSTYKNALCAAKDWNGNIWIGTSDIGIIILKNKLRCRYLEKNSLNEFENINTKLGLSSNYINTILFSKNNALAVTNNGINNLIIDTDLSKIVGIKQINTGLQFPSYDNKANSAIISEDGNVLIGSVEGLTIYNSINHNEEQLNSKPLEVFINKILIDNKQIDWENDLLLKEGEYSSFRFDNFFNWYKIPNKLELDYTHNTIELLLNTNSLTNQKQINYNYKLIGFDKIWNTIYSNNSIVYRNLPAGDYVLLFKASLSNDFSKSKEYSYHFSIKPPFWQSTLFYILSFLLVVGTLFYFVFAREKRLRREKLKLEIIVKSRTADIEKKSAEIELQNTLIQGINKDLTDSIIYAKRIQETILPDPEILKNYFTESFIYYKPRNIVSGDYYWIKEIDGLIYVAVVDCTGHGVPGAFMSLITSNILNEAIDTGISSYSPVRMLDYLRRKINIKLNNNTNDQINDGLDIGLICYDKEKETVQYVNANRPLYLISNNELITFASENVNIGGYSDFRKPIPSKTFSVKKGDKLFLFTDGITDQFGGTNNKKYNPARLRQFLLVNNELHLNDLKEKLSSEITSWQGSTEQTDDVLFIGLNI